MRHATAAFLIVFACAALAAQDNRPQFEVVSIKRAEAGARGTPPLALLEMTSMCTMRNSRFNCSGTTVRSLVRTAFPDADGSILQMSQIVGGPEWAKTAQFNIAAMLPSGETMTPAQVAPLVRRLLEDRFEFKAHTEPRPFPAYALVVTRTDGRLGPKLRPSTTDCPPRPNNAPPAPVRLAGDRACFVGTFNTGKISSGSLTLDALARNLTSLGGLDRVVVNRTGLVGKYEIDLHWSADVTQQTDDAPLVTAIQEQLSLKLEPRTETLPAVIIDHVERPSEN